MTAHETRMKVSLVVVCHRSSEALRTCVESFRREAGAAGVEAEVVAVGPGKLNDEGKRVALEVKVGDRVLTGKYSGTDVEIDDETYAIVHEDDIMGILG